MKKMSDRLRRILDFLEAYTAEHGYPPSIREIGQAADISSTSVVDYNLRILERNGHIVRDREVSRGIRLTAQQLAAVPRMVRIPIMGRIAAGEPLLDGGVQ